MKRKIYFLISACMQIGLSIYGLFNIPKIIETMTEAISAYPESMRGKITSLFENSGNTYVTIMALICIAMNVLVIIWALKDRLVRHKGGVVACAIVSLFSATFSIIELLAVINIIVIACAKREKKEDFPPEKGNMPVLQKEKVTPTKIVFAIILLVVYFSQFIWTEYLPDIRPLQLFVGILFYIIMIVLSLTLMYPLLRDNFRVFIKNYKVYIRNLIGSVGKFYLVYLAVAFAAALITKSATSVNQENIEALSLWISIPLAVIYAPLVEESLFRGCIRRFIKNDKVFIIVSAIVFGLLHTAFSETGLFNIIVMGLPYMTIGGFLAYLYVKTNNMFANISFHAFHNAVVIILVILLNHL